MPIVVEKLDTAKQFVPNLRMATDNIVRGGQPEPGGLKALKDAGVRLIINLRSTESGLVSLFRRSSGAGGGTVDPELEAEKRDAKDLGLRFVQIPLDVFGHPDEEHFEEFIGLVTDPDAGPAFVHCLYGRDRTGLMMAVYRVVADGWAVEKAYAEMVECGFDPGRTNLSDALFKYAKKRCNMK